MNKKRLTIGTGIILMIVSPLMVISQPMGPRERFHSCNRKHIRWRAKERAKDKARRRCPILIMFDQITDKLPEMLNLSEAQIDKFNELKSQHRQILKDICKQLERERKDFKSDLESILTDVQKEKLHHLQKQFRKHRKAFRRGKGRRRPMLRPRIIVQAVRQLDLPEEKLQQIKDVLRDAKDKLKSIDRSNREQVMQIIRETMEQIKEILSPEEFDQLKDIMRQISAEQRQEFGRPRRFNRFGRSDRFDGLNKRGFGRGPSINRNRPPWENKPMPAPPPRAPEDDNNDVFLW